jgi:hypothetical protein
MPLQLSVNYYNDEEAKLFKEYDNYTVINQMIRHNLVISEDEFKSYMLFTEYADEDGWRTYRDLADRVQHRLGDIEDFLDFSQGSIQTKMSSTRMNDSRMTERIGVSLGLNVINKFHSLTEADWAITPNVYIGSKRVKDFDYQIPMASDGSRFIQVENKGSVNDNNNNKTSSVSTHYRSIKGKKESILDSEKAQGIARHQNIYYGTIGVLDNHNTAKVWLVDPEAYYINWNPKKYKLISRLIYYAKLFKEIGININIQNQLYIRIEELIQSQNYMDFNNKPLKSNHGLRVSMVHTKNFASINYNEVLGSFFFIKRNDGIQAFMIAIPKSLINLIISQDFEQILNYEYINDEMNDKVTVGLRVRLSQVTEEVQESELQFVLNKKAKSYDYQSYQKMDYTNSGRIFGIISPKLGTQF